MNNTLWTSFCKDIEGIYNIVKENRTGNVATYIPQLAKVDNDLFGISVVTIDNKIYNIGDCEEAFCIQSCSKPMSYCIILKEHSQDYINNYIGREPSGAKFNEFVFDDEKKPHNPLINAGAIMACSLIKSDKTIDERYEHIMNTWRSILGKKNVSFDNSVYLSEFLTANRNFALAYIMKENNIFPDNLDIKETLKLYFQACSISMNSTSLAKYAALLANGGMRVDTKETIFDPSIIRNVLCMMYSSGMYDYSGRWAFDIGLPAKSGVSGSVFIVIPNVCGICIYSPRLDDNGNSVRAIEFARLLTQKYRLHMFDVLISGLEKKKELTGSSKEKTLLNEIFHACNENDIGYLKHLLESSEVNINTGDYDDRYPLHICTDKCYVDCIKLLLQHGADPLVKDKWNVTPLARAIENKCDETVYLFMSHLYSQNNNFYNELDQSNQSIGLKEYYEKWTALNTGDN
jgi:glutaminase